MDPNLFAIDFSQFFSVLGRLLLLCLGLGLFQVLLRSIVSLSGRRFFGFVTFLSFLIALGSCWYFHINLFVGAAVHLTSSDSVAKNVDIVLTAASAVGLASIPDQLIRSIFATPK